MKTVGKIPRGVWALGLVSLFMDVSSEMIHALLPVFMVTSLGASTFVVGLVEGVGEASALIVKVFSGPLSDRLGRRKPLAIAGYGLGALSKPLFAIAPAAGFVLFARLADRIGKGVRGAPRDALVADLTPPEIRGAAFGLRQSLDTIGAIAGPLIALGLMRLWHDDFRAVFWVAVIPGLVAVAVLALGVREEQPGARDGRLNPIARKNLRRLPAAYWWVVATGALFTLARCSEAFLILRAREGGLPIASAPLVLIGMNVVYALSAYPFGALADRTRHDTLLALGLAVLIAAHLALSLSPGWPALVAGIALWGLHMGMTQGLLAAMVAGTAPADLRGTAFGLFNLVSGGAMLVASALTGFLWDRHGARAAFLVEAALGAVALVAALSGKARFSR